MTPDDIAQAMTGDIHVTSEKRREAFLPSPMIQNHASFLHLLDDGVLLCAWFGGTLEGKSDISIFASVLTPGAGRWGAPQRLSHDTAHSEQNPVFSPRRMALSGCFTPPSPPAIKMSAASAWRKSIVIGRNRRSSFRRTDDFSIFRRAVSSARRCVSAMIERGCCRSSVAFSDPDRNGTAATIRQRSAFPRTMAIHGLCRNCRTRSAACI